MDNAKQSQDFNPDQSLAGSLMLHGKPGESIVVVGTPEGNKVVRLPPGIKLADSKF